MIRTQSIAEPRPLESVGQPRALCSLIAIILVIEALMYSSILAGFPGPTRYFAAFWAISYAHSFSRRIFLGTLLRALHLDNGNYALIAVLGWLITTGLLILVIRAVVRLLAPLRSRTGTVMMVVVLLSPATVGVLINTTGDPVQIGLLALFLLMITLLQPGRAISPALLACLLLGVFSTLIQEAAIFFIGPILAVQAYVLRRAKIDQAALAGYLLGALPVLLLTMRSQAPVNFAPMHFLSTPITNPLPVVLPTFSRLLAEENATRFHSGLSGLFLFFRATVSSLWLPALFTVTLAFVLPDPRRWRRAALALFLLNLPLWVIAYDFGRFSTYLFSMLLFTVSTNASETLPRGSFPRLRELPFPILASLLLLTGLTNTHALPRYIMKGLGNDNQTFTAAILVSLVTIYLLVSSRQERQQI